MRVDDVDSDDVFWYVGKNDGFSVRCVQDRSAARQELVLSGLVHCIGGSAPFNFIWWALSPNIILSILPFITKAGGYEQKSQTMVCSVRQGHEGRAWIKKRLSE